MSNLRSDCRDLVKDRPDEVDAEIAKAECQFDLSEVACDDCGDSEEGHPCHFWSDGGHEPRDGKHLCKACSRKLFLRDEEASE